MMWTRAKRRVMHLNGWMNAAWRLTCIQVRVALWPLCLWLVWHHLRESCWKISSLIYFLLSHLTVTGMTMTSSLVVLWCDLEFMTLEWCVWPLHMHRWIIISHNLVTEIKTKLTRSKIETQIAFHSSTSSKFSIWLSIPPLMQELSSFLCPNPISIW